MPTVIDLARDFAIEAHGSQRRRFTEGAPYWHHCRDVAELVVMAHGSVALTAAAWLHDVIEDTPVTLSQLRDAFGAHIAGLVWQVTYIHRRQDGPRRIRKAREIEWLRAATPEGQTLKLADIVANCQALDAMRAHDPKFAALYVTEKRAQLAALTAGSSFLHGLAAAALA